MAERMMMQFLTLSIYVLFMGFTFCDGFKLHIGKKLVWSAVFLFRAVLSLKLKNEFDLTFILPLSTLLALLLCVYEKIKTDRKK